ncbi:MAG TPA: glycoside hydrolase family 15 protein [Steroidobacteraceae bacterium]|nr:glycoside hydrolase family 15 protein [Steroidobacteraceae bacterium]
MEPLDLWVDRQFRHAARAMLSSVSPLGIVKTRPGFGQTVVPKSGSIVASPVLAAYDPDPDYFFHWFRDSAVVIDALRLLMEDGSAATNALAQFSDFVHFALSLQSLDGRELVAAPGWRARAAPEFSKFLRSDADLAGAHGEAIAAETRVNPDGTLDISSWPRPQHDGPALRALTLMRWQRSARFDPGLAAAVATLLSADLAYTRKHWRDPCFDIWEEEQGLHYYTLCVAGAALEAGAAWMRRHGDAREAQTAAEEADTIRHMLDAYWFEDQGYYKSRVLASGQRSAKELDIAVILATVHGAGSGSTHSVHDPRAHATLAQLEALFDANYAINRDRPPTQGPAMGRYAGDVYYSGGAYYFSTLAAAEFCFRAAVGAGGAHELVGRGNAYLETVRRYTPPSGDLSEQFDQNTGVQTSARHLAWSYAAFISCISARRAVA